MIQDFFDYIFGIVRLKKGPLKRWETNIFKSLWLNDEHKIFVELTINGTLRVIVERNDNKYKKSK